MKSSKYTPRSKYRGSYRRNSVVGATLFSSVIALGTLGALNFYGPSRPTELSKFPDERKISISLDDYVNIQGKTTDDYGILQIYNCNQTVPRNTEMVVESKTLEDKCSGLALIPKQ